jgi:hypothetical protein
VYSLWLREYTPQTFILFYFFLSPFFFYLALLLLLAADGNERMVPKRRRDKILSLFYFKTIPARVFFSLKKKGGKLLKGFQTPFSFFFLLIWLILLKEKKISWN